MISPHKREPARQRFAPTTPLLIVNRYWTRKNFATGLRPPRLTTAHPQAVGWDSWVISLLKSIFCGTLFFSCMIFSYCPEIHFYTHVGNQNSRKKNLWHQKKIHLRRPIFMKQHLIAQIFAQKNHRSLEAHSVLYRLTDTQLTKKWYWNDNKMILIIKWYWNERRKNCLTVFRLAVTLDRF